MSDKQCGIAVEYPRFSHIGNQIQTSDRIVRVVSRFRNPCIVILEDVLSEEECDWLIQTSGNKLKRSTVIDPISGLGVVDNYRTSKGTFFRLQEDGLIAKIEQRITDIMQSPIYNGEGLQVMKYEKGEEYKPHFDYFNATEGTGIDHLGNAGQRVSTLIIYLNDVELGGETIFPTVGLTVVPKRGSAVYFEYCNSLGQVNPLSLHGGLPVLKGEKWIATKWMRQNSFQ